MRSFGGRLLQVSILLMLAGCASRPRTLVEESPRWPSPPEPARLRHVQNLSCASDLGVRESWLRRLVGDQDDHCLQRPSAVARERDGRLFVADLSGALLSIDPPNDAFTRQSDGPEGPLISPVALLLDGQDSLLVVDSAHHALYVYGRDLLGARLLSRDFERPTGLAWAPEGGILLVADAGRGEIVRMTRFGERLPWGAPDSLRPVLNTPTHICQRDGRIVVTDSFAGNLISMDGLGRQLSIIGQAGTTPGSFARPKGVALDSKGRLYAADALFGNVQIFDREGRLLLFMGQTGTGEPGDFNLPGGIFIDDEDRLHVADTWNGRVQIFQILAPEGGNP